MTKAKDAVVISAACLANERARPNERACRPHAAACVCGDFWLGGGVDMEVGRGAGGRVRRARALKRCEVSQQGPFTVVYNYMTICLTAEHMKSRVEDLVHAFHNAEITYLFHLFSVSSSHYHQYFGASLPNLNGVRTGISRPPTHNPSLFVANGCNHFATHCVMELHRNR